MAYTQYFGSTPVSNWTANGSKESGHDFIDQIDRQQGVIDNKKGEYDTQKGQLDNSRNTYQDLFRNRQSYSDAYRNAKESEGVNDANAQYQKSLNAVNATNAAMNTLPSSINAGSNVVLNASQRNAALGNQMGQYQASLDNWTRQNAGDREAYQTALASAQNMAGQEIATQRQDIQTALQDYQNQMNYANELYNQLINERQIMRSIYGDMYEDEYKHMQNALEAWAQNLQAETERYKEGQANYRAKLSADAQRYAADAGMRLQQYMDQKNAGIANSSARSGDLDRINKVYSQYQAELGDLDRQTKDFGSYLFGNNSLFGTGFGFGQTTAQKARDLRNKGFEDYLYNADPYAQKLLREKYSDLLGTYGIGG